MNNWFKMDDWTDAIIKKKFGIEIEYINQNNKINPNYNDDYLLVTDIKTGCIDYYNKFISLFKKDNRFVCVYECIMHKAHLWKFEYIINNFNLIFQNSTKLTSKKNIYWIPCYNYYMKHPIYNESGIKDNFCCVSPIFDLGFSKPFDKKKNRKN